METSILSGETDTSYSKADKEPLRQQPSLLSEIMPCHNTFQFDPSGSMPKKGSGEFTIHSNAEDDESGSFSLNSDTGPTQMSDFTNSCSVIFQASDSESNTTGDNLCDHSVRKPFQHYSDNSLSTSVSFKDDRVRSNFLQNVDSDNSCSIVFEHSQSIKDLTDDSVVFEHSSPNKSKSGSSRLCSDSSYGGSIEESDEQQPEHHINFTLSSQKEVLPSGDHLAKPSKERDLTKFKEESEKGGFS